MKVVETRDLNYLENVNMTDIVLSIDRYQLRQRRHLAIKTTSDSLFREWKLLKLWTAKGKNVSGELPEKSMSGYFRW